MRLWRLARLAAEAEGVRLRALAGRIIVRAVLGVIALAFVLGAIVFAHLAAWYWLRVEVEQTYLAATGILGGADLGVALVLALLAARSTPSRTERDAMALRRQAIDGMRDPLSLGQLLIALIGMVQNIRRPRGKSV